MNKLNSFARAEGGNIAILYGFMLVLLLFFTGGAVDFTRRNAVRADLIESLDAAGLAIAQLDEENPPELAALSGAARDAYLKQYGERFFHENFDHESVIENFALDFNITPQFITPTAQGAIKTLFLGAAEKLLNGSSSGFNFLSMAASTQITRRGSGPIELALVLDVTGSMNSSISGKKKIASLRDASDALLDVLFGDDDNATSDFVKVAVVPFNAMVNAGGAVKDDGTSAWDSNWSDTDAEAFYHGARYLHVTGTSAIDLNTKVNHFRLFESNVGTTWKGCFEARPYPLDEIDIAAGASAVSADITNFRTVPTGVTNSIVINAFTSAPDPVLPTGTLTSSVNTKFVPNFAPDGPNCNDGGSNDNCEWSTTTSTRVSITYSGAWFQDPETDFSGASYPGTVEASGNEDFGNSWIDDRRFTRSTGTALDKYLPVVNYFRRVLRSHVGGTASQCPTSLPANSTQHDPDFHAWLQARGATECFDDEYILRDAYVGTWNSSTQKYENRFLSPSIDETLNEATNDTSLRGPNNGCTFPILLQSDEKDAIHDHIHALSPAGNTNSAEGLMWGWRVLSPEAPFVSDIPYNDNEWQKAVVLMTDGFNVTSPQNNYRGSAMTAYGFARESRMGVGVDSADEMKENVDRKLLRICTRMKQRNILVYAITFGLSDNDPDEKYVKDLFRACATEQAAPYYFDAPAGEDLEDAFQDIAADLVKLHVSR